MATRRVPETIEETEGYPQSQSFGDVSTICDVFELPRESLLQPGRELVAGVDVDGAKTPAFTSSHERCRKAGTLRNYNVLLFSDVILLGKLLPHCVKGGYKARVHPLLRTTLSRGQAAAAEPPMVALNLQLQGKSIARSGNQEVDFSPAPSDSSGTDITIWCTSQTQASGLLAAHAAARTAQREALRVKVAASRSPRASSQVQGGSAAGAPPTMPSAESAPLPSASQRGSINVSPPQHRGVAGSPGDVHSVAGSRASAVSTLPPPPQEPGSSPPAVDTGGEQIDWSPTGIAEDSSPASSEHRSSVAFDGVSAGGSGLGAGWDVASVTSYGTSVSAQLQQDGRDPRATAGLSTPVRRPQGFRRLVPGQHSGGTHTPEAANAEHSNVRLQVADLPRLPPFNEEFAASRAGSQGGSARAREAVQDDLPTQTEATDDDVDSAKAIKNARHRYNVYTEIYETEKAYVASLQSIVDDVIRVLNMKASSKSPIVRAEDIPKMFSNIEHIMKVRTPKRTVAPTQAPHEHGLQVNATLLSSLVNGFLEMGILPQGSIPEATKSIVLRGAGTSPSRGAAAAGAAATDTSPAHSRVTSTGVTSSTGADGDGDSAPRLSSIYASAFRSVAPFFRLYAEYCRNFWSARDLVDKYATSSGQFRALVQTLGQGDLTGQLIKPVQRICKYPLLFRDILKHMSPEHPARADLQSTLETIERVATDVNAKYSQGESLKDLMKVHTLLDQKIPDLIQPGREVVSDFLRLPVSEVAVDKAKDRTPRAARKAAKPHRLFLLNNLLVFSLQAYGNEAQEVHEAPGGPRYTPTHIVELSSSVTLRPGYAQSVAPAQSASDAAAAPAPAAQAGAASGSRPPLPPARSTARTQSTSMPLFVAQQGTNESNPGKEAAADGSDLYTFDLVYSKVANEGGDRRASKGGGNSTRSIIYLRLWFDTPAQREEVFGAIRSSLETSAALKDNLKQRRSAASAHTRRGWVAQVSDGSEEQDAVPAAVPPTGRRGFATTGRMSGVGLAARRGLGSAGGLASLSDKYARRSTASASAAPAAGPAAEGSPAADSPESAPAAAASAAGGATQGIEATQGKADAPVAASAVEDTAGSGSDSASLSGGGLVADAASAESGGRDLSNSSDGAPPQEVHRSDSSRQLRTADRLRATKKLAAQGRRAARRKVKEQSAGSQPAS